MWTRRSLQERDGAGHRKIGILVRQANNDHFILIVFNFVGRFQTVNFTTFIH
jgi:hypothetical protein